MDGAVTFVRDLGKIEVYLSIEDMGKPRIPMKQICEHIMRFTHMGIYFPQRKFGFYYHNKYLNELNRRDGFQNYEASLEKIANNVIWSVTIHSQIESDKVSAEGNKEQHHYILECFSENLKSDLKYVKRSFIVYHHD